MNDTLDVFDIFDIVSEIRNKEQQHQKLLELSQNDPVIIQSVIGLLEAEQLGLTSEETIINGLLQIREGTFDPKSLIGHGIDRFTLTDIIEIGGSSYIFKAEKFDEYFSNQICAVKVIKPHVDGKFDFDLLNKEANILLSLKHKYIVDIDDAGVTKFGGIELPFYRMDIIQGTNILEYFKNSIRSIEDRVSIFIKLCDAFLFAHESSKQVIHSDIKPENILIDNHGDPKIIDFGISQQLYAQTLDNRIEINNYHNLHSSNYSPPELLTNNLLTVQADIYSLGVLLYVIMTERTPQIVTSNGIKSFDNKRKLLSKNIPSLVKADKYYLWLDELDSIVKKATQPNPSDRFSSMREFRNELTSFVSLQKVNCANKNIVLNAYKRLWTSPKSAITGTFGTIAILTILILSLVYYDWVKTTNANFKLKEEIGDHYSELISASGNKETLNYKLFLSSASSTLFENSKASDSTKYKEAMKLGKVANNQRYFHLGVDLFSLAKKFSTNGHDFILASTKLGKAYYQANYLEFAEDEINSLYREVKKNNFNSIEYAIAYIELLNFDMKYISPIYDDQRNDIDILNSISNKYWQNLSAEYKSELRYQQAVAYFYEFYGDPINPSIGSSESTYAEVILPLMSKALIASNQALQLDIPDNSKPRINNLKSRILFELKQYDEAQYLARENIINSIFIWGELDPITEMSYISSYATNRFQYPFKANESLKKLVSNNIKRWSDPDTGLQYSSMLVDSFLSIGEYEKAENVLNEIVANFDINKNILVFKGLDSIRVAIVNYLEFSGFDLSNEFSKSLLPYLNLVFSLTQTKYPDYIEAYELSYLNLINYAYDNDFENTLLTINKLKQHKQDESLIADSYHQLSLNLANIAIQFNEQKLAYEIAIKISDQFVWSELEKKYSPITRNIYHQLSKIFEINDDDVNYRKYTNLVDLIDKNHDDKVRLKLNDL